MFSLLKSVIVTPIFIYAWGEEMKAISTKIICDLNNLIEQIEDFYFKYEKNTQEIDNAKCLIEKLKSSNLDNSINSLYYNFKKIEKVISRLNVFSSRLRNVLFEYYPNNKNYPILKEYLISREYYTQDERDNAFQEQLKNNDYDIYLINDLNLVNLFDKNKVISFATKNELDEYIENEQKRGIKIIIKPKTNDFEKEYEKYYNHLLKHGYNYSVNYGPLSIAKELASLFKGQVLTEGFIFYSRDFEYPEDFNNEEYLKKLNEFLSLHHDKTFVRDYREMSLLEQKVQLLISAFCDIKNKLINVINNMKENGSILSHEILFLEKCYIVYGPKFGYWDYIYEDYYKALDAEFLRKSLNDNSLGAWKLRNSVRHSKDYDYTTCIYGEYFDWGLLRDIRRGNEKLKKELDSLNYSKLDEIEQLIQDKYVIVGNSNLNYETLLEEYYSNFGMNPKEFAEMIRLKYDCKVVCPDIVSQSTKLVVRKAS